MNRLKRNLCALVAVSALVGVLAPGVAVAAGIAPTPEGPPPSGMIGGWRVTGNQVLADGGATTFHYERDPAGAEGTADAEIQWHRASAAELGQQLQAQGFVPAGTLPTCVTDQLKLQEEDWAHIFTFGTAQVYVYPAPGQQFFQAVGVWEEAGFTYALSARVGRLYMLERLLERVERLDGIPGGNDPFARKKARRARKAHRAHRHPRGHGHRDNRGAQAVASRSTVG
jgi:hypothetical protein